MSRKPTITVIDYGAGNLLSVCRALHHLGANTHISKSYKNVALAERLLLPGVGAFGKGMQRLRETGLEDAIKEFQSTSRPFMGICLGMQMMLDSSEEFGNNTGLGIIPGKVVSIPRHNDKGIRQKTPRIGWYRLDFGEEHIHNCDRAAILNNFPSGQYVYFVHSYHAEPTNDSLVVSISPYYGHNLNAIIVLNNMVGCQFHPEKSGKVGLKLLNNFLLL